MTSAPTAPAAPRLTSLSHGGGCGCKIAPNVLSEILKKHAPLLPRPEALLVGTESSDDAAVYLLNPEQALIATTDFFMPIVDDPFDFGRIAATNALSDVYAMGGTPIMALALVGMPIGVMPLDTVSAILRGGESVCAQAGIPIAGGHSIDSVEPIYGLVAMGLAHPSQIRRNDSARAGDVIVLGKPLGVGIQSAALKKEALGAEGYARMIANTTQLNTPGKHLAGLAGVHAMTDVTGFGLLGHLLEVCRGSQLRARLNFADVPIIQGVVELTTSGMITGASGRNWASYGADVSLAPGLPSQAQTLLTDPQTSGGLLVACAPDHVDEVLSTFRKEGFAQAAVIGTLEPGVPGIDVR